MREDYPTVYKKYVYVRCQHCQHLNKFPLGTKEILICRKCNHVITNEDNQGKDT